MQSTGLPSSAALLLKLCLAALAIRWSYDTVLYLAMGDNGLMGVDSSDYLQRARSFASALISGKIVRWDWIGVNPMQMPLFTWTSALSVLVSPSNAPFVYVLFQGVVDSATCLLIYCIARDINPCLALPAGIAAAINPTQFIAAGMLYPDTLFTFFVAALLLGSLRWLKAQSWPATLLIAIGFVGAAFTRILIAPFGVALIAFLLLASLASRRLRWRAAIQLGIVAVVFGSAVGTISLRNHVEYGYWQLTPQSGLHLSRWIVPLVRQAKDGTPWRKSYEELEQRAQHRFGTLAGNTFEQSEQYTQIAMEELPRLGFAPIVKAWIYGAAINLGTPAVVLSPPVIQLPRTGFYDTGGSTMIERVFNFMFRSDNKLYTWVLLAGICGTAFIRLIQLVGVFAMLRVPQNGAGLLLLAGWCAYILLINGPIASPKYRLPMEPALAVLTAAGWQLLRRRKQHMNTSGTDSRAPELIKP